MAQSTQSRVMLQRAQAGAALSIQGRSGTAPPHETEEAVEDILRALADLVRMEAFGARAPSACRAHFGEGGYLVDGIDEGLPDEAVWALLRMLAFHAPQDSDGAGVACIGDPSRIDRLEASRFDLPSLAPALSVPLEFQPGGWWYTLDIEFGDHLSADTAAALDAVLLTWVGAAAMGAFQVDETDDEEFGASMKSPAIGDDFASWSLALPRVSPLALNSLVNMLAWFSRTRRAIARVSLG